MALESISYNDILSKALDLFPYDEPNSQQQKIMSRIVSLKSPGSIMIEATIGSGKTAASLSSLIARMDDGEKILVITRTVSQMEPVLREWARIIGGFDGLRDNTAPRILPLQGKARMCKQLKSLNKNKSAGKFHPRGVHLLCKSIPCKIFPEYDLYSKRFEKDETYLLEKLNYMLAGLSKFGTPSMDKVIQFFARLPSCGYYDQKRMIAKAQIVVVTYPFLRQPLLDSLIKNMKRKKDDIYFLIDEAHNLVSTHRTILTRDQITKVKQLIGDFKLFKRMEKHMDARKKMESSDLAPEEEWDVVHRILNENVSDMREKYILSLWDLNREEVVAMVSFIKARHTGFILTSRMGLEIMEPTPSNMLSHLQDAALVVYQSGTFSPLHHYKRLFGINAELLQTREEDTSNQFRSYVTALGLTSKYSRRHKTQFRIMARVVWQLYATSPRHSMLMCPSYDFKEKLMEELTKHEFVDKIIEETRESVTNTLTTKIINTKKSILLVGVAGGKISEGVEIVRKGKSLISLVIFAGLPFVPPSDDKVIIQKFMERAARDRDAAREFMYSIPLSRKVRQAYGRTIRTPQDRGALVILDFRGQILHRALRLRRYHNIPLLEKDLRQFFDGYEPIEIIY